jgi:hypothetical protein
MTTTKRTGPRTPPAWRQLSLITDTGDDDHPQSSEEVLPPAHRADPPPSALSLDGLPLILTVSEAAVVLRVSRTTAYKLADDWRTSDGREGLPVVQLGHRLVVRRVDLAALVGLSPTG